MTTPPSGNKIEWIHMDLALPDPEPPPGGWNEPCKFEDHQWVIEIEEGRASVHVVDPCNPEMFDPARGLPACSPDLWQAEDFFTAEPIPVQVTFVNDSTPSTPAGPAEYSYYLDIRPPQT